MSIRKLTVLLLAAAALSPLALSACATSPGDEASSPQSANVSAGAPASTAPATDEAAVTEPYFAEDYEAPTGPPEFPKACTVPTTEQVAKVVGYIISETTKMDSGCAYHTPLKYEYQWSTYPSWVENQAEYEQTIEGLTANGKGASTEMLEYPEGVVAHSVTSEYLGEGTNVFFFVTGTKVMANCSAGPGGNPPPTNTVLNFCQYYAAQLQLAVT